ncbi:MAG: hypothetical protein WD844_17510 [Thermoleophilaceae bacterium]
MASPRAANFVQWWEGRQRLKQERYLSFVEIAEAEDVGSLDALLDRARDDDELSDFVEAVIEHVVKESSRAKVAAFGRLLRLMTDTGDDTQVDEAWLLLRAVAELDPPHLRVLRRLREEGNRYHGVNDYALAGMFERGTVVLYPLLKTLERHGLAGPLRPAPAGDPDSPIEWAIWDFGLLFLDRLFPPGSQRRTS